MLNELQNLFNEVMGRDDLAITPKSKIDDNLGLSSFSKIQLICAVEEKYGIEVPNRSLKKIKTVQDLMDLIESLKN